jgi:hypothetical protein
MSRRPDPRLHQTRIANAIALEKPQLIVFATPQFCTSRMCGPVVDIVRTLLPTYGKRVAFTHQEIWQDFATKKVFSTIEEWRLQSESLGSSSSMAKELSAPGLKGSLPHENSIRRWRMYCCRRRYSAEQIWSDLCRSLIRQACQREGRPTCEA